MSLYLDASVLIPLFVTEPASERLEAWVRSVSEDLFVADLAAAEFRSGVSRRVRMKVFGDDLAASIHDAFDEWRDQATQSIENIPVDIRAAERFVRRPIPRLLTPDAIHLATCRRLALTLVTNDEVLTRIAEREQVATLSPG